MYLNGYKTDENYTPFKSSLTSYGTTNKVIYCYGITCLFRVVAFQSAFLMQLQTTNYDMHI